MSDLQGYKAAIGDLVDSTDRVREAEDRLRKAKAEQNEKAQGVIRAIEGFPSENLNPLPLVVLCGGYLISVDDEWWDFPKISAINAFTITKHDPFIVGRESSQ